MAKSNVSRFRHRVEIQTYTETRDEEGGSIRTWGTDSTVWARVNPIGGDEREVARQTKSKLSHRVTMRKYEGTFTNETRLKFDGKFFNIISVVDPDYRGCFEIIDCAIDEKQTA